MPKNGDKANMYCSKCKVVTPHTYKSSTAGDFSKKIFGNTFKDIGSGWYCDNCGKKSDEEDYSSSYEDSDIEDLDAEDY